jgi:hypothetical protein
MKTRAAIATAPNKPLQIHEIDLDGLKAGSPRLRPTRPDLRYARNVAPRHSYLFISGFVEDHLRWHAERLAP